MFPFQIGKRNLMEIVKKSKKIQNWSFPKLSFPFLTSEAESESDIPRHQNKDQAGGPVLQHLIIISSFPGEHLNHPHASYSGMCHR